MFPAKATETTQPQLSPYTLARRLEKGIPLDSRDYPVDAWRVAELQARGCSILYVSRWLNAACLLPPPHGLSPDLQTYPVATRAITARVPEPEPVYKAAGTSTLLAKEASTLLQLGIPTLHEQGFTGQGVRMAVFDDGFLLVDTHSVFRPLRSRGGLIGARDFVQPGGNLFIHGGHGTGVLSLIVAQEAQLWGAAPGVDVLLLRTENNARETLAEEAAWVAAAEYADSVGVDIFQTSLGYNIFEGGVGNHTYASLDGNTALITRGADIAASKGILVVNSLGNEGTTSWRYLLAPADGDSVLAVGAVDSKGKIARFSSWGPRVDGRIKPDVVAQGAEVVIFDPNRGFSETVGTSYSAPLIAGLAACLLQARPRSTGWDLFRALTGSADRYLNPDDRYGNGQPYGPLAMLYLPPNEGSDTLPSLRVYVTPEANRLFIWGDTLFAQQPKLDLVNLQGQVVATHQVTQKHDSRIPLVWLLDNRLSKGIYQLRAYAAGKVYNTRIAVVQGD